MTVKCYFILIQVTQLGYHKLSWIHVWPQVKQAPCKRVKNSTVKTNRTYLTVIFPFSVELPNTQNTFSTNYRFLRFFLLIPPALTVGIFTLLSPFFDVDASLSRASEEVPSSLSTLGFTSMFVDDVPPCFCAEYSSFSARSSLGPANRFMRDRMSAINQVLFIAGRMAVDSSIGCISPDGSSCSIIK